MSRINNDVFLAERLQELVARAERTDSPVFGFFLTPPEVQSACAIAKQWGVTVRIDGGYEEAERKMVGFFPEGVAAKDFPLAILKLSWPHQSAPSHRDLLGSVMALGIQRQLLGDIVLLPECAYLFVQESMSQYVADHWTQAGNVTLRVERVDAVPKLPETAGVKERDTVASLRLDAVIAGGFHISRAKAADLIHAGYAKLRYVPTLRSDMRVECNDVISVRGMGRLRLLEVGTPTKKGRIPITMMRFGNLKSK